MSLRGMFKPSASANWPLNARGSREAVRGGLALPSVRLGRAQVSTHHTENWCDHNPAPFHPGTRSVSNHILNGIINIISACKNRANKSPVNTVGLKLLS